MWSISDGAHALPFSGLTPAHTAAGAAAKFDMPLHPNICPDADVCAATAVVSTLRPAGGAEGEVGDYITLGDFDIVGFLEDLAHGVRIDTVAQRRFICDAN